MAIMAPAGSAAAGIGRRALVVIPSSPETAFFIAPLAGDSIRHSSFIVPRFLAAPSITSAGLASLAVRALWLESSQVFTARLERFHADQLCVMRPRCTAPRYPTVVDSPMVVALPTAVVMAQPTAGNQSFPPCFFAGRASVPFFYVFYCS